MARVLIGDASKPNGAGGYEWWGDTYNQAAEKLTMPEDGSIVAVGVWAAGKDETATARLCIWNFATGALLGQSASVTLPSRSFGSGNVELIEADLTTPVELAAGTHFYAGFARSPARSHQVTGRGSGHHWDRKRSTWPGSMDGADDGDHGFGDYAIGCHAYYEADAATAGVKVRRSGAWVQADRVAVRRSGAWVDADRVRVRRSGSWVDAG